MGDLITVDPVSHTQVAVKGGPGSASGHLGHHVFRWWLDRWPLMVVLAVTGLAYTVLAFALNAHLQTYGFDLGVYYEALRGYAHLGLPLVGLKGVHYDLLGDHFEPMLAVLVPTYWIWPSPDVLLVDQTVLVALSVVPVWMFSERRFGGGPALRGWQRSAWSAFMPSLGSSRAWLVTTFTLWRSRCPSWP